MKDVDELLRSLREHGTVDSEGQFTVSLSQARRKLKHYHSSDTARFLLLLVSAGVAAGATRITIDRVERSYRLWFAEAYLCETELLAALEKPQSASQRSGGADLVAGIQGSFARQAESVEVDVFHPDRHSFCWRLTPESEEALGVRPEGRHGIQIWLRFRADWRARLRSLLSSLGGYAGMTAEERLVDRYADRALLPLHLQGQPVARSLVLPSSPATAVFGVLPEVHLAKPCHARLPSPGLWRGVLALGKEPIQLVVHGVAYCQIEALGVSGTVYCDELLRDASKEKIVGNETYTQLVKQLEQSRYRLFEVLVDRLELYQASHLQDDGAELLAAFLLGRLSSESRGKVWTWMITQLPATGSPPPKPSVAGLMQMMEVVWPGEVESLLSELLEFCADALANHQLAAQPQLAITLQVLRALQGPARPLLEGYLLLGSGALHALAGEKAKADKDWFDALKAAWGCSSEQAQELFHTHLGFPEAHIAQQASRVLRMASRQAA